MVKIFRIEYRRAEALGRPQQSGVVVFELIAAGERESRRDVVLVDRYKGKLPEKRQPLVDLDIVEQKLASRYVSEFGQALARHAEECAQNEFGRNVDAAGVTNPLRSRVKEDVRVEK